MSTDEVRYAITNYTFDRDVRNAPRPRNCGRSGVNHRDAGAGHKYELACMCCGRVFATSGEMTHATQLMRRLEGSYDVEFRTRVDAHEVGATVEGGIGDDHDIGEIIAREWRDGRWMYRVMWQSGTANWDSLESSERRPVTVD